MTGPVVDAKPRRRRRSALDRVVLSALTNWMAANGYQIGLTGVKADVDESIKVLKALAGVASATPIGPFATLILSVTESGCSVQDAAQLIRAVVPFGDLIARKGNVLLVVMLTDHLDCDEIAERLRALMNVGKGLKSIGPRIAGMSGAGGDIIPLLLYRSRERLESDMEQLADISFMSKHGVMLQCEFVDLKEGEILRAPARGMIALADRWAEGLGVDNFRFSGEDLDAVYAYMDAAPTA